MNISTESDFSGLLSEHPWAEQFAVMGFRDGGISTIPHNFFIDWLGQAPQYGQFQIGRCSGFGIGSTVKYDAGAQSLRVGRYVAAGHNLRIVLNGQHDMRTISTYMFAALGMPGLDNAAPPQYADTIIKNDVWIGDEVMVLGGAVIENGCVIGARSLLPPNFRSEPYGVYAGTPARLLRFRFSENVRAALLALAWWDMPLAWLREHNPAFLQDMTGPESAVLEMLAALAESRRRFELAGAEEAAA